MTPSRQRQLLLRNRTCNPAPVSTTAKGSIAAGPIKVLAALLIAVSAGQQLSREGLQPCQVWAACDERRTIKDGAISLRRRQLGLRPFVTVEA
jgi:hypothetical protein